MLVHSSSTQHATLSSLKIRQEIDSSLLHIGTPPPGNPFKWTKMGQEYLLTKPSKDSARKLNYQRLICLVQSKNNHFNAAQFEDAAYMTFHRHCDSVGEVLNRFGNPRRIIEQPSILRTCDVTKDCFHGDSYKEFVVFAHNYIIPDEIEQTFGEKGYYEGTKIQVHAVDALLASHNRKRSLMLSNIGKFAYEETEQWNNLDIMDVISLAIVAYPQAFLNPRKGLIIIRMLLEQLFHHLYCRLL
jgi:hypothetical protein